jgi:hypothetical protein
LLSFIFVSFCYSELWWRKLCWSSSMTAQSSKKFWALRSLSIISWWIMFVVYIRWIMFVKWILRWCCSILKISNVGFVKFLSIISWWIMFVVYIRWIMFVKWILRWCCSILKISNVGFVKFLSIMFVVYIRWIMFLLSFSFCLYLP